MNIHGTSNTGSNSDTDYEYPWSPVIQVVILTRIMNIHGTSNTGSNSDTDYEYPWYQ